MATDRHPPGGDGPIGDGPPGAGLSSGGPPGDAEKGLPDGDLAGRWLFDGTFPLPTAVLRRDALEQNIATMAAYCARREVLLAPHAKTTMCPSIIRRQLAAGAWAMTVATAWQANALAGLGVRRLLLANQVVDAGSVRLLDRLLATGDGPELYAYADSPAALAALEAGIGPAARGRLRVLVELGVPGGRTGLRSDRDALALARRVRAGPLAFGGLAAFEGILSGPDLPATLALVDTLVDRLAGLARAIDQERFDATSDPAGRGAGAGPIVTAGGSSYFDRVADRLPAALAGTPYRTVLRSGCYVTHDAGAYADTSPFGARPRAPHRLREALHVWAPVLSRPEPGLALAGLGRRDASADAGLPVPRLVRAGAADLAAGPGPADLRPAGLQPVEPGLRVTAVNDQHAYLSVPEDQPLAVGDLVAFGISHPCTTFDKWRAIPIVDESYRVVELARTLF